MYSNLILLLIFFAGIVGAVLFYLKKKQQIPLENRKEASKILWETNFKSKSDWIILGLAIIAQIYFLFIYKSEKIAFAVFYIPMWFILGQTIFRNRQTLIKSGFSQEQAAADFKFGLFMLLAFSSFLVLMFNQINSI